MACGSCIEKLALRLVRNHKIDFVDALMRAEKGIERLEERTHPEKPKILSGKGNPSDYSQNCLILGNCNCADDECMASSYPTCPGGCISSESCYLMCPDALPNSHYVSNTCHEANTCSCQCRKVIPLMICICRVYGACGATGTCEYDCDEGYEWDGEACVSLKVLRRLKRGVGL